MIILRTIRGQGGPSVQHYSLEYTIEEILEETD